MSSAPRYSKTVSSAWTAPIGYHRTVNQSEKNPADEAQRFPYWQRNLRVIPLANVLCGMGFTIVYPFLPMLVRSLGVSDRLETWVGNMMMVFYLISFASNPIWGGIADHYGRKIMVLRAMIGMGLCMALVPFAPSAWWFAALFSLIGLFNGFLPAGMALLAANTPPQKIGTALSYAQAGGLTGHSLGPALGAVLLTMVAAGQTLFWVSGLMLLCGGLLVALFVREVKQLAPGPWRPHWIGGLRELLRIPLLGPLIALAFLFSMLWNGNITIVSLLMMRLCAADPALAGAEPFWVGAAALALTLSSVLVLPLWGRAIDRFGPARVVGFAGIAAVITHLPLLVLETPLQLVLARIAFGMSAAAATPAVMQLMRQHAPRGMDARAMSYASSFQFLAMGVAPFCAGLIGPAFGLRAYFAVAILALLGGLVLWLRAARRSA